jgi:ABC-type Fe3+ transport system permease subunit
MTMPTMPGSNPAVESEISSKATTALVTGILSIFCCALLGIWSISSANQVQALINQTGVGQQHASKAQIGKILGIIALVLWGITIVLNIIMAVIGGGAAALQQ